MKEDGSPEARTRPPKLRRLFRSLAAPGSRAYHCFVSTFSPRLGVAAILMGGIALACSAELDTYSTDADTGSTHAFISVQRTATVDSTTTTRADAFAGFLRVPADVDTRPLFEVLGLRSNRPVVGQCKVGSDNKPTALASGVGRVELLEAGDVVLGSRGAETSLAPHALPSVSDSISGVVYTTRDRSAALPAGGSYAVRTTGGSAVPSLNINQDAPAELQTVTVGGVPLAEVDDLNTAQPVDLTWATTVNSPNDIIYAELATADGAISAICAFRDELGSGTIPAGTIQAAGPGRISLHRVRTTSFATPGVDVGEVSFDFEVAASLTFAQ